ncbi:MAG: hypothetical protein ABA06_01370 [Parcubacteria bacterium C7867-001]|nr:MAG: hypothetical protein ABA06_01370 [Parcubacteria bacterium C7867-001]
MMKKQITSKTNHLTKTAQKLFVERLLRESGFSPKKKFYVKDRSGKLIVRFTKEPNYE